MIIDAIFEENEQVIPSIFEGKIVVGTTSKEIETSVKSIAHRGYSAIAPENTIPAYILAKQKGFKYAECDVAFTKDDVAVLLHDDTIDRTSDGSGSISSMTYADVWKYDFGSWKSAEYAGTKIATFEEFIKVCKFIGLHPYIEIKDGNYTQAQIESIVDMVKKTGMQGEVTYISFNSTFLGYIKAYDSTATLGYVTFDITSSVVNTASALKTDTNDVFVSARNDYVTNDKIALLQENDLPLQVWCLDEESDIESIPSYVSGVTSNILKASDVLYAKYMTYTAPPEPDSPGMEIIRTITSNEILYGYGLANNNPPSYTNQHTARASYNSFDIFVEPGSTYKFEFESTSPTAQMGCQFFNSWVPGCVERSEGYVSDNIYDPGWQENGAVITVPVGHYNGYSIIGVRLTFRMDTSNSAVTEGFIKSVTISKVIEQPKEYVLIYEKTSDDLSYSMKLTGDAPNYCAVYGPRTVYEAFDLRLEGGSNYKFEYDATSSKVQLGCQFFTQTILDAVESGQSFDNNSLKYDLGYWLTDGDAADIPTTHNGSPIVGVRLTFRNSDESDMADGCIQKVYISKAK